MGTLQPRTSVGSGRQRPSALTEAHHRLVRCGWTKARGCCESLLIQEGYSSNSLVIAFLILEGVLASSAESSPLSVREAARSSAAVLRSPLGFDPNISLWSTLGDNSRGT